MGQEIQRIQFDPEDFARFGRRLADETALLGEWLRSGRFSAAGYVGGFELEGWLIDRQFFPAPINEAYLGRLASPLVVPELSKFNVELNGTPQPLAGQALSRMQQELSQTWQHCQQVARELESALILIGILPTVRESDLSLTNISPLNRFHALNTQILKRRGGQPLRVVIEGRERLDVLHEDVMLEAAATSFQVHMQVPAAEAVRYYNASQILAAPLAAVAANSPFLFERQLWEETRIPLFEQAVDTREARRVTFGEDYLVQSPLESFADNLQRFPVLLPVAFDSQPEAFCHLRLHNGTVWRWNRLLVGTDTAGGPHLRIEQRVMPAGPTIVDMIANAALYLGAARFLAGLAHAPEADLPFAQAKANFYQAARKGLSAELVWLNGRSIGLRELLREELLPMAREGLTLLGLDEAESESYLSVIRNRVDSGQNGAAWQKAFVAKYGRDFFQLTAAYLEHQRSGVPVHEWAV